MRQFFALLLFVSIAIATPADVHADEPEPTATISLEDSPTTADAALKRLSARTEKLDAKLSEIQAAHEKAVSEAKTETIGYLKVIAKDFASQGEIAEATKVWTEVVKLDPGNEAAKEYLKAIGRLDIIQKQPMNKSSDDYLKMRRVRFVTTFKGKPRVFEKKGQVWFEIVSGREDHTHTEVHRDAAMVILRNSDGYEHALLPNGFIHGNARDRTGSDEHIWRDGDLGYWAK